ncbi:hypothetical protein C8R46DRAFT_203474 [Mycena filopes]|nr:hypothetical protein C8R46DRAFT_203474 [Mycena filopes]
MLEYLSNPKADSRRISSLNCSAYSDVRRTIAIERNDTEPLFRDELQFDFLSQIFANDSQVFSNNIPGGSKLSFRDLYVQAILQSPKTKPVLKEKLALPTFATDFAMLALLTNVGRIAPTMSFFAEMRTAQRTYHPIPSLQRTHGGNLLDAPRIKAILKSSILDGETKNGLATPAQVLARVKVGQLPTTTLPNLIFVFANHSIQIGREHLADMEFLDLFLPNPASSASRARVFLWLCYRYLEGSSADLEDDYDEADVTGVNPFSDPSSPGKIPRLVMLTKEEIVSENIDPDEEKALASRLIAQRKAIVQDHLAKESSKSPAKKSKRASAKAEREAHAIKEEEEELEELVDVDDVLDKSAPLPTYRQELRLPSHQSPPSVVIPHRYSPYKRNRSSLLQHAWHVIVSSDPLADSDEDEEDEDVQMDYAERLAVISRVRGKAPTPEPEGVRPIPLPIPLHWHDEILA